MVAPGLAKESSAFGFGDVWVQDITHGWLPATATEGGRDGYANITIPKSCSRKRPVPVDVTTAPHGSIQIRSITDLEATVADMTELTDVSEPALMHNLYERYCADVIYTAIGGIICSLNPYKRLPIYGEAEMARHRRAAATGDLPDLPPHVYGVTQQAYKDMVDQGGDQALIMSGESGAGKTEACKLSMSYLAAASADGGEGEGAVSSSVARRVADCIVNSNHVLESFGNAKTFRNDNSSRFGKWVALSFTCTGVACGGSITTYLLESVRVTKQMKMERNYHCFYQLLAAAAQPEHNTLGGDLKKQWFLGDTRQFHYVNQSGCFKIDGINDGEDFAELIQQLRGMRIPDATIRRIFRLLAALLHLGNINFAPLDDKAKGVEGSRIKQEPVHKGAKESLLQVVAQLLEVAPGALTAALSSRVMTTNRGSSYTIPLKPAEAEDTRDALATAIYAALFGWVVVQVNNALVDAVQEHTNTVSDDEDDEPASRAAGSRRTSTFREIVAAADGAAALQGLAPRSTIGILDVFGFEDLEVNSFEQLCINFTNEKLQAHFTEAIFRETQAEYKAEGIDVTVVGFRDNDAQVALVEKKPIGLLALLEEECFVPKGSDAGFLEKIDAHFGSGKNAFFTRPKLRAKENDDAFSIRHYAGDVTYRTTGWLEKSKGFLRPDLYRLVQTSDCPLLSALPWLNQAASEGEGRVGSVKGGGKDGGAKAARRTVGMQFAAELRDLGNLLGSMNSRFLRCLKPNMKKLPDCFDGQAVLRQLRYTGMLECIHIRRAGFPISIPHEQMVARMRPLLNTMSDAADDLGAEEARAPIEKVRRLLALEVHAGAKALPRLSVERKSLEEGMAAFAVGRTKLFMREFLYQHVMQKRDRLRDAAARRLQRRAKRRIALRIAARRRLKEAMQGGQLDVLPRIIAVSRRLGLPPELLEHADRIVEELSAARQHAAALDAAEAAAEPGALDVALRAACEWLEANPSDGVLRVLPWARVEALQALLIELRGRALLREVEGAVEAKDPALLQATLQQCRQWVCEQVAEQEVEGSERTAGTPRAAEVGPRPVNSELVAALRTATEAGECALKELIGKKEATADLEAHVAKGLKADVQLLAASLATAELVGVAEELLGQARVLQRGITEAASAERMEQARIKREREAAEEEAQRAARHVALSEKRDAKRVELERRMGRQRQLEDEEDAALLEAAGGGAAAGVRGERSEKGEDGDGLGPDDGQFIVSKKVGRDTVTTATTLHEMMLEHRVDKSGWLLKTGHTTGTGGWKPHKWSSRFFVMMGGTLYYFRPQAMAQAAGCIELSDHVQVGQGVSLRSPPPGSFTLTLPGAAKGDKVGRKQEYPLSAGSDREMQAWMRAIVSARGKPAHALPDEEVLHKLASFTGNVAADGGSSFAVRIQKHFAERYANEQDLEALLGRLPGASPMLRAALCGLAYVQGEEAAAALGQRCAVLAAKLAVLLRCKLLEPSALAQTSVALTHAVELALLKRGRVQPSGPSAMRLLPGAVAVDANDPFHTGLGGAMLSIGMALSRAIGSHMSEASCLSLQDVFAQLGSQEVLKALFGNALKPTAGVSCKAALEDLMAACRVYLQEADGERTSSKTARAAATPRAAVTTPRVADGTPRPAPRP